jgi:hypothetical protein
LREFERAGWWFRQNKLMWAANAMRKCKILPAADCCDSRCDSIACPTGSARSRKTVCSQLEKASTGYFTQISLHLLIHPNSSDKYELTLVENKHRGKES